MSVESLGGRVLDDRQYGWADLPPDMRGNALFAIEVQLWTGLDVAASAAARQALHLRLVELPLATMRRFIIGSLDHYADLGDEHGRERARTEAIMAALRRGDALPPIVVVVPPRLRPAKQAPVEVLDGFHRATAHSLLGRRTIRALEIVLPPGSPGTLAPRSPRA